MKILLKLIFIFAITNIVYSQSIIWRQIYGGPRNDVANNCVELNDGTYMATGYRMFKPPGSIFYYPKTFITKFDRYGNIIWDKFLVDSLYPSTEALTITQDSLGNVFLPYDSHLAKMDINGNIIWDKDYSMFNIESFRGVSFTDNYKNLVFLTLNNYLDFYPTTGITKIDSSGNLVWIKSFYDSIPSISVYISHNNSFLFTDKAYYVCGEKGSYSFIIKTDTSGNLIWKKRYINSFGIYSIAQNSENTFIAAGRSINCCSLYCLKFDSSGNEIWSRSYQDDSLANLIGYNRILKNPSSNFVLGTLSTYNIGRLVIIDSLSNILTSKYYYYPPGFYINQINANNTSDSGYIISGSLDSDNVVYNFTKSGGNQKDILVFKTDKDGNTVFISNNNSFITEQPNVNIFPNPFNLSFNIKLNIIMTSEVKISLYDLSGKIIKQITNKKLSGGEYKFYVDTPGLSSGVYFLKTVINNVSFSNRILLIK